MTENLNLDTLNQPDTLSSSKTQEDALSTREFMEKNWDKLVLDSTESSSEALLTDKTPTQEEETPSFNAAQHLDEAYASLKETLAQKGISSQEDWIKSLIEMDTMYHQNPERFFQLMQGKKAETNLQKQGVNLDLLKEAIIKQGIKNIFTPSGAGALSPTYQGQAQQTHLYQQMGAEAMQPSLVPQTGQMAYPYMNGAHFPMGQGGSPQPVLDPLAPFKTSVTQEMSSYLKDLVQKEFASMVQKNQASLEKAKQASFSPKSTTIPPATSSTHTPSGRLKTTREILEEGCKLLGI